MPQLPCRTHHMFHSDRADGEPATSWMSLGTLRGFHILSKILSAAVDCSASGNKGKIEAKCTAGRKKKMLAPALVTTVYNPA